MFFFFVCVFVSCSVINNDSFQRCRLALMVCYAVPSQMMIMLLKFMMLSTTT